MYFCLKSYNMINKQQPDAFSNSPQIIYKLQSLWKSAVMVANCFAQ